jgi:hypothetical protein
MVAYDGKIAQSFFCDSLQPHDPFPFDHHWICARNMFVNQIDQELQQWRNQEAQLLRVRSTFADVSSLSQTALHCQNLSNSTWPRGRVRWVFSASKVSTVKFGGCHSAIVTARMIHAHRKSHPWMITPKSQFLLGKRRDNLRDKIILSE